MKPTQHQHTVRAPRHFHLRLHHHAVDLHLQLGQAVADVLHQDAVERLAKILCALAGRNAAVAVRAE